ncbi:hypothetical protein M409DRAFT_61569 [Zasmidium cellare ATCC 36951]|uniref:Uncharacterized protein n=1 Tax=Zasmidium cellare ATCC 36951 TaxID=1080233 RepID=A0A6A6BUT4_ZASCE|nr:uncharacterized protein M409DRAFT_61569 [Zasmidium cellare ATCC 36951]KAF2158557.1 hypothetical protein M409DRAFT_61569 [Zasmidium cellare ATCC 36951]
MVPDTAWFPCGRWNIVPSRPPENLSNSWLPVILSGTKGARFIRQVAAVQRIGNTDVEIAIYEMTGASTLSSTYAAQGSSGNDSCNMVQLDAGCLQTFKSLPKPSLWSSIVYQRPVAGKLYRNLPETMLFTTPVVSDRARRQFYHRTGLHKIFNRSTIDEFLSPLYAALHQWDSASELVGSWRPRTQRTLRLRTTCRTLDALPKPSSCSESQPRKRDQHETGDLQIRKEYRTTSVQDCTARDTSGDLHGRTTCRPGAVGQERLPTGQVYEKTHGIKGTQQESVRDCTTQSIIKELHDRILPEPHTGAVQNHASQAQSSMPHPYEINFLGLPAELWLMILDIEDTPPYEQAGFACSCRRAQELCDDIWKDCVPADSGGNATSTWLQQYSALDRSVRRSIESTKGVLPYPNIFSLSKDIETVYFKAGYARWWANEGNADTTPYSYCIRLLWDSYYLARTIDYVVPDLNKVLHEFADGRGRASRELNRAIINDEPKVVEVLVNLGWDLTVRDEEGDALQIASFCGNERIVQTLLNAGADVNAAGHGTYGSAIEAAQDNHHTGVERMLRQANADGFKRSSRVEKPDEPFITHFENVKSSWWTLGPLCR